MTYLLTRHLYPIQEDMGRYFAGRETDAEAIIAVLKADRYRDHLSWLAMADLLEECGYRFVYDLRSRIAEYFE